MSVRLEVVDEGVLLDVRAHPGSRANELRGARDGRLRVAVTAAPEKGKANKSICSVVAKSLGLKKSQVRIHSGDTSQNKRLLIADITEQELRARLTEALADGGAG